MASNVDADCCGLEIFPFNGMPLGKFSFHFFLNTMKSLKFSRCSFSAPGT